jgi:hypothetical protein
MGAVAALGSNSDLVQVYEGNPTSLIKKVVGILPTSSTQSDIKFNTSKGYRGVGAAYGTVLTALDKYQFGIDSSGAATRLTPGIDGYTHTIGLIAEANKTVYGDQSDTSGYPGIAAAGSNINISGPTIRRVMVSLAVRAETDVDRQDIIDNVKSAVASVVNQSKVGQSIAIGSLVSAAENVNGVGAISVLFPEYSATNDRIQLQFFEKALVVDIDQDVTVSFVGV